MCDITCPKANIQTQRADVCARCSFGRVNLSCITTTERVTHASEKEQTNTASKLDIKSASNRLEQLGLAESAVVPVGAGGG